MSIKYYHLAKDEELPDEFCAIRDVGGEPSEYTFYAPEAENAKMRHDLEEANNQAEEVCIENAKLRELCVKALEWLRWAGGITCPPEVPDEFTDELRELGVEVDDGQQRDV